MPRGHWARGGPADDPGIRHRPIVGTDDAAGDRHATPKRDVNLQAGSARLWVAGDEAVGIKTITTGLAGGQFAIADLAENEIVAGSLDGQMTGAWPHGELERSIGRRLCLTASTVCFGAHPCMREEVNPCACDGSIRAFLGHAATDDHAAREGQVDRLLDRSLGPLDFLGSREIELPGRRRGVDEKDIAWRRVRAKATVGIGLKAGRPGARWPRASGGDLQPGIRDGLAGVGIGDAAGEDLGRLQRHRHEFRVGSVVGLDVESSGERIAGRRC